MVTSLPSNTALPTTTDVSSTSSANTAALERVELSQLLNTYQNDLDKGQTQDQLIPLARQITAAAKVLDQNVTLPVATTGTAVTTTTQKVSKVDVYA